MEKNFYKDLCFVKRVNHMNNNRDIDVDNLVLKLLGLQQNIENKTKNSLCGSFSHGNIVIRKNDVMESSEGTSRSESCDRVMLKNGREELLSNLPKQRGRNLLRLAFYNKWIKAIIRPYDKFLRLQDIKLFNKRSSQRNRQFKDKNSSEESKKIVAYIIQDIGKRTRNMKYARSYENSTTKKIKGELIKCNKPNKSRNKPAKKIK